MIPVIITTKHRGVFFGYAEELRINDRSMPLRDARMAIYWATTGGLAELASDGPNDSSRIGSKANIEILHDITAIWRVSEKAEKVWLELDK